MKCQKQRKRGRRGCPKWRHARDRWGKWGKQISGKFIFFKKTRNNRWREGGGYGWMTEHWTLHTEKHSSLTHMVSLYTLLSHSVLHYYPLYSLFLFSLQEIKYHFFKIIITKIKNVAFNSIFYFININISKFSWYFSQNLYMLLMHNKNTWWWIFLYLFFYIYDFPFLEFKT